MTTAAAATRQQRAQRPPMDRVLRTVPFSLRAADPTTDGGDGLTLDGWAAVFNRETLIDSWEGRFFEQAAPGSMKKSFRENPPRIQFDHGTHPLIGSIPIASLRSIAEETDPVFAPEGGAHVIGRVFDNWLTQPVRDAMAEGAINGMSFRFSVVQEQWRTADGKILRDEQEIMDRLFESWLRDVPDEELLHRTLKEVRVPELGPVVWPAYEETSVGVRGRVVIDLAAAKRGDTEERRKLAAALFAVDRATPVGDDEEVAADVPDPATVSSTGEDGPDTTQQAPADHPTSTGSDTPDTTARQQPAAGEPRGEQQQRDIDYALAAMRQTLSRMPDSPPPGLK